MIETKQYAFPNTGNSTWRMEPEYGMTLRDWFAGQAVNGFCSMSDTTGTWSWLPRDAAEEAYKLADAMLAERAKGCQS